MPKIFSAREIMKKYTKFWFIKISQKWSHLKMKKWEKIIIIPIHNKDIPLWTFKSILEQAGINYDDFLKI